MNENRLEIIERCTTPRGEIQLQRRGTDYEIISNGTFLMATYNGESEKQMVKAALDACETDDCSVLIGGLGVGYSLAAALRDPRVGHVTVVEIEQKIIEWHRTYLSGFSEHALDDKKTTVIHADLIQWIPQTRESFDAICLDIDNGPDWTVFEENHVLYENGGLEALSLLLNPGGAVSFWSASSSQLFLQRLRTYFSEVEELAVEQKRNAPDYIYIARKPCDALDV